jgi:DNA-binding transcriptional regulator GbsR (MarR family)
LAEQLGVTKAAISVQVRTLEKHLLCQKLPTSSDRKDYYYISDDFSMNAVKNSIVKIQRSVDQIELTLQLFNSLENVDAKDLPSHDMSRRRFIEMQALHQMYLNRLVGLEEEWDERRQKLLLDD